MTDSEFMDLIVETFLNAGEPSAASYRVRPIPGQAFPVTMRVQCSKAMRHAYPLGTKFKVSVNFIQRERGGNFLRAVGKSLWEVIN